LRALRPFSVECWPIRLLDESRSGTRLESGQALEPGSVVQVFLKGRVLVGEVRHCRPVNSRFHLGIQIDVMHLDADQEAEEGRVTAAPCFGNVH
jgi:hypothetical protein